MKKILPFTLLACGLLFIDVPEAAAHKEVRYRELPPSYQRGFEHDRKGYYRYRGDRYHVTHRRHKKMPRWLKRDRSFRKWYRHSRYGRDRRLSWITLFEIYQRQHAYRYRYYRY